MRSPERYYFAARYSRNPELRNYRALLLAAIPGAVVTSRWIDCHGDIVGGLEQSFTPEALAADPAGCWQFGQHDLEDLADATAIVSFTGAGGGGKGGRHIEHGIAIAYVDNSPMLAAGDFRLILVGPRENIFHCHPRTEAFATWPEFFAAETAGTPDTGSPGDFLDGSISIAPPGAAGQDGGGGR